MPTIYYVGPVQRDGGPPGPEKAVDGTMHANEEVASILARFYSEHFESLFVVVEAEISELRIVE